MRLKVELFFLFENIRLPARMTLCGGSWKSLVDMKFKQDIFSAQVVYESTRLDKRQNIRR